MPTSAAYVMVFAIAVDRHLHGDARLRRLADRLDVVALPSDRAVHAEPMPMLGGVAMLVGFLSALTVAWRRGASRRCSTVPRRCSAWRWAPW
jgi:UDP-N-acetylmuramyl pentapeptide phosphotransferase/UDP-N-acetylglucosamine-1-phosphate transferase